MPPGIGTVSGLDENLRLQDRVAQKLKALRHLHGALDLETIQARPVFDGDELKDLEADKKNRAKDIIEDFMIAANGVTARYLASKQFPSLRRVVRVPKRWDRIVELAAERGSTLPKEPDAKALEQFLVSVPKPLFGDNGSGMHTHQSIWKGGKNLFFDAKGYGMISQTAKHYIGGLLKHANALMAFCAPSTNSYKRLVPGYEAPVNLVYSLRNRSAAVRIPMYSENPKSKRIEFRPPDPMCNPYLSFSALLMAGLDGVKKKIDPGQPFEGNMYELEGKAAKKIPTVPGSLEQAIDALEADHKFLLEGGVFTQDVIDVWIEYKRAEIDAVRLRPHPWEFHLYFDM